jgi:hypothetical protein
MDIPHGGESRRAFSQLAAGRLPPRAGRIVLVTAARADVVLLMHMQTLGKPEPVRPSIDLFHQHPADQLADQDRSALLQYRHPAGVADYVVEETSILPVDAELLAVLPCHCWRNRWRLRCAPGGARKTLLRIRDWDFNWQSEYRYARPVALPRSTTLGMRFTYDNSTHNVRNPHQPRPASVRPPDHGRNG